MTPDVSFQVFSEGVTGLSVIARAAGIVDGATGKARPLDQRLLQAAAERPRCVAALAADGLPAVATARRLAAAHARALVAGLARVTGALGADRGVIVVEERARELRAALARAMAGRDGLAVALVPDVLSPRAPAAVAFDAASLIDLELAHAARGASVIWRAVTVAGAVARPGVYRVPIGTTIDDLCAGAGGSTCGPAWLALGGGPLTGRILDRDDVIDKAACAIFVVAGRSDLARLARRARLREAASPHGLALDQLGPRATAGNARPLALAVVTRRLGLDEHAPPPPWQPAVIAPPSLSVPLKQSLGVAAVPLVRAGVHVTRGQLIAQVPDGCLGVPAHAPMAGVVREVTSARWGGSIVIVAGP